MRRWYDSHTPTHRTPSFLFVRNVIAHESGFLGKDCLFMIQQFEKWPYLISLLGQIDFDTILPVVHRRSWHRSLMIHPFLISTLCLQWWEHGGQSLGCDSATDQRRTGRLAKAPKRVVSGCGECLHDQRGHLGLGLRARDALTTI